MTPAQDIMGLLHELLEERANLVPLPKPLSEDKRYESIAFMCKVANALPDLAEGFLHANEALQTIREAGSNGDLTAAWMQQWAAWGMEPEKWPKPSPTPPQP